VSVAADQAEAFRLQASQEGLLLESIGYLAQQEGDKLIQVVQ